MSKAPKTKKKGSMPASPPAALKRNTFLAVLAVLLLAGWGIRLLFLQSDPPETISWSQGPFTDGAVVVHNARNMALYGEWIRDYCEDIFLFPLSSISAYITFAIADVGRWQAAWPSTIYGVLSIAAVALALAHAVGRGTALLWSILAFFNYFLILFQRIPIAEPAMIFLVSLSFLFFAWNGKVRGAALLAGFFAAAAPLFGKAHAFYFPVVLLIASFLASRREEGPRLSVRHVLIGMAAAFLLWVVVLYIPHGDYIRSHVLHESVQKHEGGAPGAMREFVQNLISMGTYTRTFDRMPLVTLLGFLGLVGFFSKGRSVLREEPPPVLLLALWMVVGWFVLSAVRLPAPRYLSVLVYPLVYFACRPIVALAEGKKIVWRFPRSRHGMLLFVLFLFFAIYQPIASHGGTITEFLRNSSWGVGIHDFFIQKSRYSELVLFSAAQAVLLLALLLVVIAARGTEKPIPIRGSGKRGRTIAGVLVLFIVVTHLWNWIYWTRNETTQMRDASRDLTDWIGPGAKLMGSYAPTLGLDNDLSVYPYFGGLEEMRPSFEGRGTIAAGGGLRVEGGVALPAAGRLPSEVARDVAGLFAEKSDLLCRARVAREDGDEWYWPPPADSTAAAREESPLEVGEEIGVTVWENVFDKYGITHVVVVSQGDHKIVKEQYPRIYQGWSMVLSYPLRCRYSDTMGIFRIPGEVDGFTIHSYEPGLFERAVDVAKASRWEEALSLLQAFARERPANADGHYLVGFMYNELGEEEKAIDSIRRAIALRPERPYYLFQLGEIYGKVGRRMEAREILEHAQRMNPRDRDVAGALQRIDGEAH